MSDRLPTARSQHSVADFVAEARSIGAVVGKAAPVGRLLFAIDATQSREPTWDLAAGLQARMFEAAAGTGGLQVQLVYFRGFDECRSSRWHDHARPLVEAMGRIGCRAGHTQIMRVLNHAIAERERGRLDALVLIGDACEEDHDAIAGAAARLRLMGVPIFAFHEGSDRRSSELFRELARVTKGAFHRFDAQAPATLLALLRAAATYASGGQAALKALADKEGGVVALIASQVGR